MQLYWKPPPAERHNGTLTGYTVEVKDLNWTEARRPLTTLPTTIKIDRLRPNTKYTFQVSAMTEDGEGPASDLSERTAERGIYFVMGSHLGMITCVVVVLFVFVSEFV